MPICTRVHFSRFDPKVPHFSRKDPEGEAPPHPLHDDHRSYTAVVASVVLTQLVHPEIGGE